MIYFILLLGFIFRLILINQSFWLDEGASLVISNRPLTDIFSYLSTDFHPPLHYLITHLTLELGFRSEALLRLPNVIFGVLTIYVLYLLLELLNHKATLKIFSRKIPHSLIAALFLSLNPLHIYYSQELRMYSLSALLVVLSWYLLALFIKTKRNLHLGVFTLVSTLSIFTFYGGFFNLFAQLVFIFISHRRLLVRFLSSLLVTFLLFLPWLPTLLLQFQGSAFLKSLPGWVEISGQLDLKSLLMIPAKFSFGRINFSASNSFLLSGAIVTLYYISLVILSLKRPVSRLFLLWLVLPIITAAVLSLFSPMLGYWRFIYLVPAFTTLMALGLLALPPRLAIFNLFVIISTSLLANLIFYITPSFHREDWRSASQFALDQQQTQGAQPIFVFADAFAPVLWYAPDLVYTAPLKDLNNDPVLLDQRLSDGTAGNSDILYFHYLAQMTDPGRNIPTWLDNAGYHLVSTYDFSGVGFVDHYTAK